MSLNGHLHTTHSLQIIEDIGPQNNNIEQNHHTIGESRDNHIIKNQEAGICYAL